VSELRIVHSNEVPIETLAAFLRSDPRDDGSFRRSETAAYYAWLLSDPPGGASVSVCAVDGSRIVGSLSAVLRPTRIEAEVLLSAKLEDMKTDPTERGRGVMSRVFGALKEEVVARGARLLIGGPTSPFSFPIFVKRFGFVAPFEIRSTLRTLLLPALSRQVDRIEEVERFPSETDELWRSAERGASCAVLRSAPYLTWRYTEHPDRYRILAWRRHGAIQAVCVVKETRQRGIRLVNIVELLGHSARAERALLAGLAAMERRLDPRGLMVAWPPNGTESVGWLGLGHVPRPATTRIVFLPVLDLVARDILLHRRAWRLAPGDFFDI
jgi:GNAT superfamily N-acetyltransferase